MNLNKWFKGLYPAFLNLVHSCHWCYNLHTISYLFSNFSGSFPEYNSRHFLE